MLELPIITFAYLVAAVLFILSLRGLSGQETARRGNVFGMVGMALAIGATLTIPLLHPNPVVLVAIVVGAAVGGTMAAKVGMTKMPQLVALLHSFAACRCSCPAATSPT